MNKDLIKGALIVAAFSAVSYLVIRDYDKRQERRRKERDVIHFQLF